MQTTMLSDAALALLRLHVERNNIRIDDSNREAQESCAGRVDGGSSYVRLRAGITLSIHQGRPGHGYRPFHPRSIARRISRAR